jgi:hypothetical protein
MEHAVEVFVVVNLAIAGLSHVRAPGAWVELFTLLRERGRAGVFAVGFPSLLVGSIIVAFHPVWSWPGVLVTLFGWAHVLKAAVYFLLPDVGLRGLQRVDPERTRDFVWAGLGLLVLAAVVAAGWL